MSIIFIDGVHTESILHQLWGQCDNEELCDVVLIGGTEKMRIPAHRCIISATSEFLNKMCNKNATKEVAIPSVNGDILHSLIKYCYLGFVPINAGCVVEMLKAADMLCLPNVVTACGSFLAERLNPKNCLECAHLAEQYHCETLLKKAQDYSLEHFMQVRETDEFLRLNVEQLSHLLACDELCISAEKKVFLSVTAWINHDRSEREKHQAKLLKLVRLPFIDESFLTEKVKPLCSSEECLEIYKTAVEHPSDMISVKPRRTKQLLIALTRSIPTSKKDINYYCPERRKWMKLLKDLQLRDNYGFSIIEDDIYLVGGKVESDAATNTVVSFNLKTLRSKDINPMKENRKLCGAAELNGYLYAVGGCCDSVSLTSMEKWNSRTNAWSDVASMAVSRCNFGIATLKDKLYVVGGFNYHEMSVLQSVECYDPLKNIWTTCAAMREARVQPGIAVANGQLYVLGGKGDVKTFEKYDPETDNWTMLCNLSEKLHYLHSFTLFRDKLIVCYSDVVKEYINGRDEWKTSTSLKGLESISRIFTYTDKLLTYEFLEN